MGTTLATAPTAPDTIKPVAAPQAGYVETALSEYLLEKLPNGVTLAVKRQPDRGMAVARILLASDGSVRDESEAGYAALALDLAASGATGTTEGSVEATVSEAGGSISLSLEDYDDVSMELVCPSDKLSGLLGLVARSLASPSFAETDFDPTLRQARIAERREAGDPLARAETEIRSDLFKGHAYGLPPGGTLGSLATATPERIARFWSDSFGADRLSVVAVADIEPARLASSLASSFGSIPGGGSSLGRTAQKPPPLPLHPWFKAVALSAIPGSVLLRGEFGAPEESSADYPALAVALLMLDDLVLENLRAGRVSASGAWTDLSAAAAPAASISVYRTEEPAAAKAAIDAAISELAAGRCLGATVAQSLDSYKSRAIVALYSGGASPEGMAALIARDLAAGGDGTAVFRAAGRIRGVSADDVVRVARERLLDGPSAWIAVGDPALVRGLRDGDFVRVADRP